MESEKAKERHRRQSGKASWRRWGSLLVRREYVLQTEGEACAKALLLTELQAAG